MASPASLIRLKILHNGRGYTEPLRLAFTNRKNLISARRPSGPDKIAAVAGSGSSTGTPVTGVLKRARVADVEPKKSPQAGPLQAVLSPTLRAEN